MKLRLDRLCFALAILMGVLPLWASPALPLVDLPQHLHLISILHRLKDPTTLYPEAFALRSNLTPYLGYYYAVSLLNWILPLGAANRLFLSAYVAGMPLGMAFLLRSLKRPTWPALLALPFAYGDSFAWGFLNYCSALPLAFLCCGFMVHSVADPPQRRWPVGLALSLVAVLLFHVQVFLFLGAALPALAGLTPAFEPAGRPQSRGAAGRLKAFFSARSRAWAALLPGGALFLIWVVGRLGQPSDIEPGAPWKAWGPALSRQNLSFKTFAENRDALVPVLANMLRDGSDRWALYAVFGVAALGLAAGVFPRTRGAPREGNLERLRLPVLGAIALLLYFLLPFDVFGYVYYLNTRYAHLAAPLILGAVPPARASARKWLVLLCTASAGLLGFSLGRGFSAFGREEAALEAVSTRAAPRPRVMGLLFNPFSGVVNHPVYVHAAAVVARERGGLCNFSFALTPHSPLRYRSAPPPTFPSEWHPEQFRYDAQGRAYDHFLLRGASPEQVFGPLVGTELSVAARAGDFWLVKRAGVP